MATVTKKSHSFDAGIYSEIEQIAEAENVSASALLTEGAQMLIMQRHGLAAVTEWEQEHGFLTEQELEAADRVLDSAGIGR